MNRNLQNSTESQCACWLSAGGLELCKQQTQQRPGLATPLRAGGSVVSFLMTLGSHMVLGSHVCNVSYLPQGTANGFGALFSRLSQGVTKVTLPVPPRTG